MNKKEIIGMIISLAVLMLFFFLPVPIGLSTKGMVTIGLLLFFLIMLITEALPVGVICFLSLALLPTLGITESLQAGLGGFTKTILFFVLASFGLAEAVTSTPIVGRILHALLSRFGKNVKMSILAIMVSGAIVSAFVTDVPTVVIFMGIGVSFLELFKNEKDRSKTGKSLMMGIPIAIMIGGVSTPAGSGINILTIGLFKELAGVQITFIQWMICSIPIVLILIPLAWFILIKLFPPAEMESEDLQKFIESIAIVEKPDKREKMVLFIGAIMFSLWILSSFFPVIDVTVVALFGCSAFFLPGINVLSWKEYMKAVSWTSFILIGTVLCIASAVVANGVTVWFVEYVLPASLSISTMGGIFLVSSMIFLVMLIVPVAPALIGVLAPVMISLGVTTGINPALLIMTLGLCAGNCYLFPIDTIPLITYTAGYYKMTDMPKATIWLQLAFIALASLWLPIAGKLVAFV